MARVDKIVKDTVSVAFAVIKSPVGIGYGVGTLAFSYSTSFSILKSFTILTGSIATAFVVAMGIVYAREKIFPRKEVEEIGTAAPAEKHPIVSITGENYRKEVLESDLLVVMDAYATWCGPCKMVAPIFAELNESMQGKIKFVKFNVEADQELSKELNIQAMPTFIFFKDGKAVGRHVGAMDKEGFLMHFVDVLASKAEAQKL